MLLAAPAAAKIPASLYKPSNCERIVPAAGYAVYKCDDGVPAFGGTTSNPTGAKAVTVPAKYGGNGFVGLPQKGAGAGAVPGADSNGNVALDVDLTLPTISAAERRLPDAGLHARLLRRQQDELGGAEFGGADAEGEKWHYNNAWFAARGYVVLNYTARGFVDGSGHGSTGQTELDSRSYEVNDYQSLACQVLGAVGKFNLITGRNLAVNPTQDRHHGRVLRRRLLLAGTDRSEVDLHAATPAPARPHVTGGDRSQVRVDRPRLLPRPDRNAPPRARVAARVQRV